MDRTAESPVPGK